MEKSIDCNRDSNKLKITAINQPSTSNPLINPSAIKMIIAFITSRNNPRVKTVTGKVKRTNKGLTVKFKRASTRATIIAVQ